MHHQTISAGIVNRAKISQFVLLERSYRSSAPEVEHMLNQITTCHTNTQKDSFLWNI